MLSVRKIHLIQATTCKIHHCNTRTLLIDGVCSAANVMLELMLKLAKV